MTLMLASVTGPEEAEAAVTLGADIVDLKDPARGALGALAPDVVRAAVQTIAGRRPASAVTGDLPMEPATIAAAAAAMAETGVQFVKVGLFPHARREECIGALASLARATKVVGVMFADLEPDESTRRASIAAMRAAGFAGAMLDTARKGAGRLLDNLDIPALAGFVDACHADDLLVGLAGALEPPDIPRLLPLSADYLGFRGALCAGDRAGPLDPAAFRLVRELIPPMPALDAGAAETSVDYRLLAARGYSLDPRKDEAARNRIFVRDFVLPIRVGAYAHERDKLQRVRFNIEVDVLRPAHPTADMRDVFSYDLITDGIRMIVAQEHIALLETLAERIAALVLAHPWVSAAIVRVEKLDIVPGSVGVEIRRERPTEMANVHHLYPIAAAGTDKTGR
ncbi:MAG: dihydroneopterin aldolase [Bradyrhizobiaceae bacterium]|nr:dihydroneopterin aldolase [Hyphomicrobiales bacterium]MBV9426552.1 dihydroneopterin aldolase [Bradyrhizobiaceae bacterium]